MNDVIYEYGCEITSTKECPLNEEIRADERAKILGLVNWKSEQNYRTRVVNIRIEYAEMLNAEQVIKIIAEQLKEQK